MIKHFKNNIERVQPLLVVLVWILLFAIPLLFGDTEEGIDWHRILKIWKEFSILFIIFLINRFVLMPYLFFKKKRMVYFLSVCVTIALFSWLLFMQHHSGPPAYPTDLRSPPARENHPDFRPPPSRGNYPDSRPPVEPGSKGAIPPHANLIIMSVLLIGFDSGLIFFSKWMVSEQKKLKAERENIANKMAFLQNQISPHFFMNTLNNIHAQIDIDTEEAKDAIIKLSRMMDYMLYESQSQGISLHKEMEFTQSYVELMKLRLTDDVDLQLEIPTILPQVKIPPLLTISFIENAFKYGVSYQFPSFIHIRFHVDDNNFYFEVKNRVPEEIKRNKNFGIGIENTRKRLELLFGKNYQLNINDDNKNFKVNLSIPL